MINTQTDAVERSPLEQRRAFMKLPLEERRRQLAKQAALLADHYERPAEVSERQDWQGGDIVECT